jgi:hypothetical protein
MPFCFCHLDFSRPIAGLRQSRWRYELPVTPGSGEAPVSWGGTYYSIYED